MTTLVTYLYHTGQHEALEAMASIARGSTQERTPDDRLARRRASKARYMRRVRAQAKEYGISERGVHFCARVRDARRRYLADVVPMLPVELRRVM